MRYALAQVLFLQLSSTDSKLEFLKGKKFKQKGKDKLKDLSITSVKKLSLKW